MTQRPDEFDSAVCNWYATQSPRADWLSDMARQIAATRPTFWHRRGLYAFASAAAVAALVLWAILITPQLKLRNELARSVATLHSATFTPDLGAAPRFADLAQLPNLPFTPIEPERCRKERYKVLGARTCTIAGVPAAQIRLADDDGDIRTLCEFQSGPLAAARDGHTTIDGVQVSVWHEGGLVMGMTGPPP